jgi:hypothetical protein
MADAHTGLSKFKKKIKIAPDFIQLAQDIYFKQLIINGLTAYELGRA